MRPRRDALRATPTTAPRPAASGRRRGAVVAAGLTLALGLAACSGGDEEEPAPTGTGSPTSSGTRTATPRPTDGALPSGGVLGAKFDWGRTDRTQAFLEDLDGASTFYELVWCDLAGSSGNADWTGPDRVAAKAEDLGVELMLKIRTGTCDLTDGEAQYTRGNKNKTESTMPNDLGAYRTFVTEAVKRYAETGVRIWAVENEINSPSFWGGTPEQYRELFTAGAEAVRAADPDALVADNGLSSTTYGYGIAKRLLDEGQGDEAVAAWNAYYDRRFGTRGEKIVKVSSTAQLEEMLDTDQGKRNLAYLSLIAQMADEGLVDIRQIHFYEDSSVVPALFDYLHATTPADVPIEAWEVGSFVRGSEVPEPERVNDLVRKVSLMLGEGATKVLWLPLIPNPDGRNSDEPRIGLIDPDGTLRPAGEAFAQLATDASGAEATLVQQDGVTGVALTREGATTAYLWSDGSAVPLAADAKAAAVEDGATTTSIGEAPVRVQTDGELTEVIR